METTKVNINALVRVQLTKEGAQAINEHNAKLIDNFLSKFPMVDTSFLKTDYVEGDVIKDSLWYVFSIIGEYLNGNTMAPFINNEIEFL